MTGDAQQGGNSEEPVESNEIACDDSGLRHLSIENNLLSDHDQPATGRGPTPTSAYMRATGKLRQQHKDSLRFVLGLDACGDEESPHPDALREALAITNNYRSLRDEFGVNKADALEKYQPRNATFSIKVNLWRKKLFLIAEGLNPVETEIFKRKLSENDVMDGSEQLEIVFERLMNKLNESQVKTILLDMKRHDLEKLLEKSVTMRSGLCIIINQKLYIKGSPKPRIGTDLDRDRLVETFTRIGFDVVVENNLKFSKVNETLKGILNDELKPSVHKCLVVCILAHGIKDQFICVDQDDQSGYHLERLITLLNLEDKNHLAKIPKIYFIQACQGSINLTDKEPLEVIRKTEIASDAPIELNRCNNATGIRNVCILQSAVPGTTSLRHEKKGTFFVRGLCSAILMKNPCRLESLYNEIHDILKTALSNEDASKSMAMVPMCTSTMIDKVIFQTSENKLKESVKMRLTRVLVNLYEREIAKMMIAKALGNVA
ncbi:Hypothetical predicted protein [Cloeon dipterum]|uniref:Caspase family p20 domain-containing protein n=1 Tax=Cloeon dipterum TaxID=197152 RepID=A0A8S1C9C1_9INSE|nr:Hypothetical predicted protein [Cloeon dipterum]